MKLLSLGSSQLILALVMTGLVLLTVGSLLYYPVSNYFFLQFQAPAIMSRYGVQVAIRPTPFPGAARCEALVVSKIDPQKPLGRLGLKEGDIINMMNNHDPVVSFYSRLSSKGPQNLRAFEVIDSVDFAKSGWHAKKRTICPP